MREERNKRLTQAPVGKTLTALTIPMIVGMAGIIAFNLVDTFFVGRLGTLELAAISFTFPVIMVITSIAVGIGTGASAAIARAIGEGNAEKVKRLTTDSLLLSVLIVIVFSIFGLLTIEPVFKLLGAKPELLPLIKSYMQLWYIGVPFVIIPMVGNSAIRATGDTKTPGLIMVVAVTINIILDPLFIFGLGPFPRWGLAGAAIATVISRAITFIISLSVLHFREKMLTWQVPKLADVVSSWRAVLYIGLPATGTHLIIPAVMSIVTRLIATYGPEAVAAFGVSTRIDMFTLMVIIALSSVLVPFIGQNHGAGKKERIKLGIKLSQKFAMLWGAAMFIVLLLGGNTIAAVFNDNVLVISNIRFYLLVVPISYGFQGVFILSSSAFNALNKPFPAVLLSLVHAFILYLPMAYIASHFFGLKGLFIAIPIANALAGAASFFWLRKQVAVSGDDGKELN
ncbi:MAG: MATE family efflux transporter [bacterium]|nr:MATE family efflux transporter [bacterium]